MRYLLPHIIDETAERFPDKEAFRFYDQSLTYAELAQQANQLANLLVEQGVKCGDCVGISAHKELKSAIAIFGVMKAGAAYVPLDPQMPLSRLAQIIQACNIRQLISHERKRPELRQISALETGLEAVIGVSSGDDLPLQAFDWAELGQVSAVCPNVRLMEQDIAYIMYTSGSTGEPKGIIHTHYSGLSYAEMAAELYGLTSEDRLSNFPPLHFDQSTFDYFSGPLVGATTTIIPDEYTKIPASLSQLIEQERLTVWYSVPYALTLLLQWGVLEKRDLSSLRWVLFGGEPFPPKHLRALMKVLPDCRFSNIYGPAEVNQCAYYHVPAQIADTDEPIPIGQIWPNAEGLVVDKHDQVVSPGEVGELLIRTPTMMQGYWRRPDLNQRAFFYRQQAAGQQDVFYRTGDLVQLQPDGNYSFLGRKDRQVKSRGYRIELDEVEAALMSHEQVQEAAVFPVPDNEGSHQIHAVVITKDDAFVKSSDLVKYLSSRLPRYAVPVRFQFTNGFPRTSSGKVDRRKLQAQALVAINA